MADYGLVADLFQALPELEAELEEGRRQARDWSSGTEGHAVMNVAVKTAESQSRAKPPRSSRRSASSAPARWAPASPMSIALGGYSVALNDLKKDGRRGGAAAIERNMGRQVVEGHVIKEGDVKPALKRIGYAPTSKLSAIATSSSRRRPRRKASSARSSELCPKLNDRAMIATNTSSISITRLASTTDRPEHFIGMHFMNPVPLMELVELIRGIATEDEMFAATRRFVEKPRQEVGGQRGLPRLHRQPHPAADDQRGGLHAL